MKDFNKISDIPLDIRIKNGHVTVGELKVRADILGKQMKTDDLIEIEGVFGCPICFSEIPEGCSLVTTEFGNKVCDYCVPYIER